MVGKPLRTGKVIDEVARLTGGEENGSVSPLKPLAYYVRCHHLCCLVLSQLSTTAHPHNSISESSFFKHIDSDIPDTERLRLLLTWCTSRAAQSYSTTPGTTLPSLSEQEAAVLNRAQEEVQRLLADKKIDISPPSSHPPGSSQQSRVNDQNVSNRRYEKQYGNEIARLGTLI